MGWWAYGEGCVVGVMWEGWVLGLRESTCAKEREREREKYNGPPSLPACTAIVNYRHYNMTGCAGQAFWWKQYLHCGSFKLAA